jgi:O-antigen/teichoic acid export membrane protein
MIAAGVLAAGLGLVFTIGDPAQRLISVLLVTAMAPRMIGFIPSQANNAAELMKRSTPPALIGGVLTVLLTLFSLWAGWDLPGVAASVLAGVVVETALKLYDVHRRLSPVPVGQISPELKRRMLSYSGQGLALMLLNVVVWDRSDMLILKTLNPDIKQVTFFSLAFNLTERVLMIPNAFLTSLGVTMMAQFGRGQQRLQELVISGTKYTILVALPLLAGMACLSGPLVSIYGDRYQPLAPVLAICALLAIPKALANPPTALLQTTENQGFLIWVGCCCGVLDVVLDVLLTPHYGARGAAVANGAAQTAAAIATWVRVRGLFRLDLRLREFGRIVLSAAAMSAVTLAISRSIPTYAGMALAFFAAVVTWFASLRVTRAVAKPDAERILTMGKVLPGRLRVVYGRLVGWLVEAGAA